MGIQNVAPSFNNPPTFSDLEEVKKYLKDAISKVAMSLNEIDFMINGTLDVNNIRAEGIETQNLKAGSVIAEKINVGELSAISANLGHIVAGLIESVEIFGAYIATRRNAYPRCEMSATGNVFGAFRDAGNSITVDPDYGGSPTLVFRQNNIFRGRIDMALGYLELYGSGALNLESSGTMFLNSPRVQLEDWSNLFSNRLGRTLADDLTEIFLRLEALEGG